MLLKSVRRNFCHGKLAQLVSEFKSWASFVIPAFISGKTEVVINLLSFSFAFTLSAVLQKLSRLDADGTDLSVAFWGVTAGQLMLVRRQVRS